MYVILKKSSVTKAEKNVCRVLWAQRREQPVCGDGAWRGEPGCGMAPAPAPPVSRHYPRNTVDPGLVCTEAKRPPKARSLSRDSELYKKPNSATSKALSNSIFPTV